MMDSSRRCTARPRRCSRCSGRISLRQLPARVPEVGVSVNVHQPDTTASLHCQAGAEEHAAVTTDDQRRSAGRQYRVDAVREPPRMIDHRGLVSHEARAAGRVVVDVPPGKDHAGVGRSVLRHPAVETCFAQRFGRFRRSRDGAGLRWPQTKICRGRDERDHSTESVRTAPPTLADLRQLWWGLLVHDSTGEVRVVEHDAVVIDAELSMEVTAVAAVGDTTSLNR